MPFKHSIPISRYARGLMLGLLLGVLASPVHAQFNRALDAYENRDFRRAATLLGELADQGDVDAQYFLGRLYRSGDGVLQDYIEAHKWFNLASSAGHRHAGEMRDELAQRMSANQVERAQDLARKWFAAHSSVTTTPPTISLTPPSDDAPSGGPISTPGSGPRLSAERIAVIQSGLNDLGYDAGAADGVIGEQTLQAVRNFQSDYDLEPDGQLSESLIERMHAVWSRRDTFSFVDPQTQRRWPRLVLDESFEKGALRNSANWEILSGQFKPLEAHGVRSIVLRARPKEPPPDTDTESVRTQRLEALQRFLDNTGKAGAKHRRADDDQAQLVASASFDNTFYLKVRLSAPGADDSLSFGPYVDRARNGMGYRVVYHPERAPHLALVRLTRTGSKVLQVGSGEFSLTDGHPRTIEWTRAVNGTMIVRVDGKEVLRAIDRVLTGSFAGLTWLNQGGVYDLHELMLRSRR